MGQRRMAESHQSRRVAQAQSGSLAQVVYYAFDSNHKSLRYKIVRTLYLHVTSLFKPRS
jgi:hypothetical protein